MKRMLMGAAAAAAAIVSAAAAAGMMGGYGPGYGMGPGMMMPGMMGGAGGMMQGYGPGAYAGLDLNAEQRTQLAAIEREFSGKQWDLMKKMHDQDFHMHDLYGAGNVDENAARKAFRAMSDARNEMFEAVLEARRRMDSVLTPEQREQLRRNRGTAK